MRKAYLDHVAALARDCARQGIAYRLFVLAGLPAQTAQMARETARFVRALPPYSLTVKTVKPYPGSQLSSASKFSEEEIRAQVAALRDGQSAVARHQPHRLLWLLWLLLLSLWPGSIPLITYLDRIWSLIHSYQRDLDISLIIYHYGGHFTDHITSQ